MAIPRKEIKIKTGQHAKPGFTLVEMLIYIAIFSIIGGIMLGILNRSITTNQTEVATDEVTSELNSLLTTVQTQVNESSNLEVYPSAGNLSAPTSTGSYLKLRMSATSTDPTCIYLSTSTVYIAQGPDPTNQYLCNTASAAPLTTSRVAVNNLTFTELTVAGGHASVTVSAQITYNTTNPAFAISKTLQSAIGRVSAATFDDNLLPNADNTFDVGQVSPNLRWRNGNFAGTVTIGTASGGGLGVGTESPSGVLNVVASSTNSLVVANNGDVGINTTNPLYQLQVSNSNSTGGGIGLLNGDGQLLLGNLVQAGAGLIGWNINEVAGSNNLTYAFSNVPTVMISNLGRSGEALEVDTAATGTAGSVITWNTPSIYLGTNGDVGIGTTNPTYALDVTGNERVYSTNIPSNSQLLELQLNASGTPTFNFLDASNSGGTNQPEVLFSLENSAQNLFEILGKSGGVGIQSRLTINLNSGDVGIATTTPQATLDVNGTIRGDYWNSAPSSSLPAIYLNNQGGSGDVGTIDIAQGTGLTNIVAGAKINSAGNGYNYIGTRGASRIELNDGGMYIYTGNTTSGTAGG
ncbi:MAG: prepilin-type N-terminal cleavage/methylation domain-containing protein, partial [Patescibacteria group bacterium]|nr:prepilin-type N-terminal cleavage/methylation domain-containing protein [Patescibacteria group bacterium]